MPPSLAARRWPPFWVDPCRPLHTCAQPADAPAIATLHADIWAIAYAHILSADWLAQDLAADRARVWSQRFVAPEPAMRVLLAEDDEGLAGFACLMLAADPEWGSHIDNRTSAPV